MEDQDLIYLEDEEGNALPYVAQRYFHSEGEEYLLLAPQHQQVAADNAIVLHVQQQQEDEVLSPVDEELAATLLDIALAQFDVD